MQDHRHNADRPVESRHRERGIRLVLSLNLVVMAAEIVVGELSGSMALLADGWHMATHVGALGLSLVAYALGRRLTAHGSFPFGAGKLHALAGFTSALILLVLAADMAVESVARLLSPRTIDFGSSLPVAVIGLLVNVASVRILHDGAALAGLGEPVGCGPQCVHETPNASSSRTHDLNHHAALLHVVADALTSALAIAALVAGRQFGVRWLDPLTGVVGAGVILVWGWGLVRHAGAELIDIEREPDIVAAARSIVEATCGARVDDIRTWSIGQGRRGAIVRLSSGSSTTAESVRVSLAPLPIDFVAVEIGAHEHEPTPQAADRPGTRREPPVDPVSDRGIVRLP